MKRKKRLMSIYPNYKLSEFEKELVRDFEQYTHCDLMQVDEVTDIHTFRDNLQMNMRWYRDNVQETLDQLDQDLDKHYDEMTDRQAKITRFLKKT